MASLHTSLLAVALLAAPGRAEALPIALELERDLGLIARDLSDVCAPDCGQVSIDGRPDAASNARSRPVDAHTSELGFNHQLLDDWRRKYGSSTTFFVVAHEYGHHLVRSDDGWSGELAADAFAGCALARENIDLSATTALMRHEHFVDILETVYRDADAPAEVARRESSHPPWLNRLAALRSGAATCRQEVPATIAILAGIAQFPGVRAQHSGPTLALKRAPSLWGGGRFSWQVPACFSGGDHCRESEAGSVVLTFDGLRPAR